MATTTVKVGVDASELEAAVALAKELGERLEAARELLVECLDMQRRLTRAEAQYPDPTLVPPTPPGPRVPERRPRPVEES